MTVVAEWDSKDRRWRYKVPGVATFLTPSRPRASYLSPTSAMVKEVEEMAPAVGVRLPASWELEVRRW
jgi:hypothetical protein